MEGGDCEAEGQIRHTTPYHTSLRPPMSCGGRQRSDTPPSELSYSQDRDTGAEGGAEGEIYIKDRKLNTRGLLARSCFFTGLTFLGELFGDTM